MTCICVDRQNNFLIISFLGSSLNAVVGFNLEVTHAVRFALKTTSAFNEEPKKKNRQKVMNNLFFG